MRESKFVEIAEQRSEAIVPSIFEHEIFDVRDKKNYEIRIPFGNLLENGMLTLGQLLYFQEERLKTARIKPDGKLSIDDFEGSIHQVGSNFMNGNPFIGLVHWYYY